ncbi:MAG: NAD(P)H-dependent oxidoreductase subunit E [Myxococcota bacterium]
MSDELRARIEREKASYPQPRGALLAALRWLQDEHGWLSPEATDEVAEIFGLHPLEVIEVISFYNMLHDRPVGRHTVHVYTSLTCSSRGARGLLRALEAHVGVRSGETSADGRITLGHEECLGACAGAPMLRIGPTYHENLDVASAKALLDGLE